MKSEGSQHIYNSLKHTIKTPFGDRIMEELGNIRGLEKDEVKNYILIPNRVKDKDGKESTSSWSVHEIHEDMDVNYKLNEGEDRWSNRKHLREPRIVDQEVVRHIMHILYEVTNLP